MAKNMSRPERWAAAAKVAREALDKARAGQEELEAAMSDLKAVQEEYEGWKDNLPESLQSSPTADKLEEVCNMDLDWSNGDDLDDAESKLDEAEGVDLPRGFGRD